MTNVLPQAPWTRREDLAALMAALGQGKARYVGGAVRDTLLGKTIHDVDCATVLMPPAVIARCKDAGIKTVPTGIDHGTVTAVLPQGNVEITTLRRDVSTDGRRATVTYAAEWHEDAARRDFTINALYADPQTLEITDFFGGLADLDDLAHTLKGLSRERLAMELLAILALPDPADTVERMKAVGVLPVILPEASGQQIAALRRLISTERQHDVAGDPIRRLGALLPAIPSIAEGVAARLRLSRQQRSRLVCLAERRAEDSQHPRALAYHHGLMCALDRLLVAGEGMDALAGWEVPRFPLKGGQIVARGVAAGPDVARTMRAVEARWIAEDFPAEDRVMHLLDAVLSQRSIDPPR